MTDADHTVVAKQCTKCGETKPATKEFFHRDRGSLTASCATCRSAAQAERRRLDPEAHAEKCREWYQRNRGIANAKSREWRSKNSGYATEQGRKWREQNAEKYSAYQKQYYLENRRTLIDKKVKTNKSRTDSDPVYALQRRTVASLVSAFRRRGYSKRSRTHEILGCDWDSFKTHIERQFVKGMTWDNRSEWHIDHIVPMASAKTEEDVIRLNHFTNLRPLWAKDNIAKSDRITHLV